MLYVCGLMRRRLSPLQLLHLSRLCEAVQVEHSQQINVLFLEAREAQIDVYLLQTIDQNKEQNEI